MTFLDDRDEEALVRLPNGAQTTVAYRTLIPAPDADSTTPWRSVFGIRLQFLGDHDGHALMRLPDQTQTVVDYAVLTVLADPVITGAPDGPRTVACPNCDWSDTADSLPHAMDAFNSHHRQRHPGRNQ